MKINRFINATLALIFLAFVAVSCEEPIKPPVDKDPKPDAELDTTNQIVVQYCGERTKTLGQEASNVVYEQSAAIKLTAEKLEPFIDNRIIKISASLGRDNKNPATKYSDLVFLGSY